MSKKQLLASTVAFFVGGGSQVSVAQEGEPEESKFMLEEVVVTAEKREASLQEVPIAVTAFSGDWLEKSSINLSEDLEMVTPGLSFSQNAADATVNIRGVGTPFLQGPGSDPSSAIYIDGVYQSRFSSALFEMMDVERIEVLKGPQGTLYGRNSTGGAINVISKAPSNDFNGSASVQFGNYDLTRIKIRADIPLVEDKLLFRAALMRVTRDGYTDNLSTPSNDVDAEDLIGGRFTMQYIPSDTLTATLRSSIVEQEGANLPAIKNLRLEGIGAQSVKDSRKVFADQKYDHPKKNSSVDLTLDWDLGWASLKSITAYTNHELGPNFSDFDGSEVHSVHEGTLDGAAGLVMNNESYSQELVLSSNNSDQLEWLVGLYYLDDSPYWKTALDLAQFSLPLIQFETTNETTAYAVFSQFSYYITPKLRINLGARYSDETKKNTIEEFSGFVSINGPLTQEEDWQSTTPKVGLDYFVSDDVMMYLSYGKGFKSGAFNSASYGVPAVDPEKIDAYEIGAKTTWYESRLRANFSGFYYDYTDMQVNSWDGTLLTSVLSNAGKSEIQGVEVEVSALATESLQINMGLAWTDTEFTEFIAAGGVDVSGNQLPVVPEFTANIGMDYTKVLESGNDFIVQLNYYYSEEKFFSEFNDPNGKQDAYSLVNARVGVSSSNDGWGLALFGANLADEEVYLREADGFYRLAQLAAPRTYGVEFSYNF